MLVSSIAARNLLNRSISDDAETHSNVSVRGCPGSGKIRATFEVLRPR